MGLQSFPGKKNIRYLCVTSNIVKMQLVTGLSEDKIIRFDKSSVVECTEILYSPLFYRLRKLAKENSSELWKFDCEIEDVKEDVGSKAKLLLRTPDNCRYSRA